MSTISDAPCRWIADSTSEENCIREIFYHHWSKLKDQFLVSVNQVNQWRETMIEHINKHANEQFCILNDDYNRQRLTLDQTCRENLDTTRAYFPANNIELFNELRDACQLLEFQMSQLEYVTGTLNVYKVITIQEQVDRKKAQEKHDTSIREANTSEGNPVHQHPEEAHLHPSTIKSSDDDHQLVHSNTTHSRSNISHSDGSTDNCPICFMMFPLSMLVDDRHRHIDEHYTEE